MRKETGNYCFPNIMANMMRKISLRTQFEASMLSIAFILIGILVLAVYTVFFSASSTFIKVVVGLNAIAAFVFLSSYLITNFQQYQNYLISVNLIPEDRDIEAKFQSKQEEKNDNISML